MSNEITTTSANDMVNASIVQPTVIMALSERPGLAFRVCREFNITGQATGTASIPRFNSYWGAARGASVDTEFDGVEDQAVGNTPVTTDAVTISTPEFAVAHAASDRLMEDTAIDGAEFLTLLQGMMTTTLVLALDSDFVSLFSALATSIGSTGVDLTIAQMIAAGRGITTRANCDRYEYVLDPEQVLNLDAAILTSNAAAAVYAPSADRLIGYQPAELAARGMLGHVMSFQGALVTQSGLCLTDGGGDNVIGAAFCPSTAYNDASGATTFGVAIKRLPRLELDRSAKGRASDLVLTMRAGVAEMQDLSGCDITTDAP